MSAVATKKEVTGRKLLTFVMDKEEYGIEIVSARSVNKAVK